MEIEPSLSAAKQSRQQQAQARAWDAARNASLAEAASVYEQASEGEGRGGSFHGGDDGVVLVVKVVLVAFGALVVLVVVMMLMLVLVMAVAVAVWRWS